MKAKKSTYARKSAETTSSRPNSHDLIYAENQYMYYDTYIGGDKFVVEEALWINEQPYWSMNYTRRVIGRNFSGDFLKESLLQVPFDKPFKSPSEYSNGIYTYKCSVDGAFHWF